MNRRRLLAYERARDLATPQTRRKKRQPVVIGLPRRHDVFERHTSRRIDEGPSS